MRNFSKIAINIAFLGQFLWSLLVDVWEERLNRIKKLLPLREIVENLGLVRKVWNWSWKANLSSPQSEKLLWYLLRYKRLLGIDSKKIRVDASYVETDHRDYCKVNRILLSFVKRGLLLWEEKGGRPCSKVIWRGLLQWKALSEYGENALSKYKIRNHEVSMELLSGLYRCLGILARNTILTTGNRYEIENVISWLRKLRDSSLLRLNWKH